MNKYAQHYFNTYISKRAADQLNPNYQQLQLDPDDPQGDLGPKQYNNFKPIAPMSEMDPRNPNRIFPAVQAAPAPGRAPEPRPAEPAPRPAAPAPAAPVASPAPVATRPVAPAPALPPSRLVVPNLPGGINDTKKKWNEGKSTAQGGMQLAPGPVKQGALNYISYFTKMAARGSDELNDIANGNTSKQLGYASPMTAKDREDYDRQGEKIKKENIRLNGAPKSPVATKIPKPPNPSVTPKLPKPKTNSPSGADSYDDKDSDFVRTLSSGQLFDNKDNDKAPAPAPAPARTPLPALPTNLPGASAGAAAGFNKKSALNSIAQFNKLALDPASSTKPKDDPNFNPYAKAKGPTEGFGKAPKSKDTDPGMNKSPKFPNTGI